MSEYPILIHADSPRAESEDHMAVIETAPGLVIVVADGVGGKANGGAAARAAVERAKKFVAGRQRRGIGRWQSFVEALDADMAANPDCGETTFVVVEVTSQKVWGVSLGDSEAWLILPGGHFDLTERQVKKPFLGSGGALSVPFQLRNPGAGTLVVASDGLFKYTSSTQIEAAGLQPDITLAMQMLGDLPRLRSGALPDDLTICLCRLGEGSSSPTKQRLSLPFSLPEATWVATVRDEDR